MDHAQANARDKPPQPSRRWFQFSLRTLFLLVTVTSVGLALWTAAIAPYLRQYRAREQLLTISGKMGETLTSGPFGPEVTHEPALPDWLCWLPFSDQMVKVTCVKLVHCELTDKQLVCLSELRDLERLYMPATDVSDKSLEIVAGLPKLKRLSLWRTKVTDRGIECLGQLTSLEALDIQETVATESCLQALEKLPNLKLLRHDLVLSDQGLERLSRFPRLRHGVNRSVQLDGVTDRGIAHLGMFANATRLQASRCRIGRGWQQLEALNALTYVEVREMEIGADLSTALSKLSNLKHLKISRAQVTGSWPQLVESLRAAHTLEIYSTPCSPEGLQALSHFTGREVLLYRCAGVSLETFGQACGPAVLSLSVNEYGFSWRRFRVQGAMPDTELAALKHLTNLTQLSISRTRFSDDSEVVARLPQLQELHMCLPLRDETIQHIARAAGLKSLRIEGRNDSSGVNSRVSAKALLRLADLRELEVLKIEGLASSDEHFAFLALMPQLRQLNISADNSLTNAGLTHLGALENLKRLSIHSNAVSDDGLQHLSQLARLEELHLYSKRTSQAGFVRLQESLPNCKVHHW